MYLYLVQHAEAMSKEEDPDRPLTEAGRRTAAAVADFVAPVVEGPSAIWHSGKLRARQTAEIFAEELEPAGGVREHGGLGPVDDPHEIVRSAESVGAPLMLVGHLPHMSHLASLLLAGDPEREVVKVTNAAVNAVQRGPGGAWVQRWYVTPELVEA